MSVELNQDELLIDVFTATSARCPSWKSVFDNSKRELEKIATCLELDQKKNGAFVPLKSNLFKAFELTPLDQVRVVIIGQDPYHQLLTPTQPRAQGLSFSVHPDDEIPSSLKNIYKEISACFPTWIPPTHGDLTSWATQGVLLLNTCLTCLPNQPNSHGKYKLWMPFIVNVLKAIDEVRPNCIYVLWGRDAQQMEKYLGVRAFKLTAAHPSGMSASRGFFGCQHFLKINELLIKFGEPPISW